MKKKTSLPGQMMILASALLWSTAGILVKLIPWGSFSIASIRGLICMMVLLALRLLRGRKEGFIPVRFTKHNIAAGAAMFVTGALFMTANKLTTAANAIVLQYIAPILILIYTAVVQERKPTGLEILLTAIVFIGCVLAFCDKLGGSGTLGDILAIISGFTFAALIVINRMDKTQPEDGQIIGCGMSFICCLPFMLGDSKLVITWESVGAMLALGLIQYSLANILFAKGIKKVGSCDSIHYIDDGAYHEPGMGISDTGRSAGSAGSGWFCIGCVGGDAAVAAAQSAAQAATRRCAKQI